MYYTIQHFKDILFDGINNKLSEETKSKISELSSLINVSDGAETGYKNVKRNDSGELYKKGYKSKELEEDWESVRNFKVTKIEKKEGIEKKINEIRIALNKISEKNKIEQTLKITELISIVFENDNNINENVEKIVKFVFDTASSNAFYSEIYAELYKNMIKNFSQFQSKIGDIVINYKKSFEEINPVDPNADYDAYCDFIKENDKRKSMTTFICNLTKYDILESETLYQIIKYITFKISEHSTLDNSISIVEELCDNLYILITTTYELYKTDESFHSEIMKQLNDISLYRKTDKVLYKSMSSRASFKILDTIEYVKKQQ